MSPRRIGQHLASTVIVLLLLVQCATTPSAPAVEAPVSAPTAAPAAAPATMAPTSAPPTTAPATAPAPAPTSDGPPLAPTPVATISPPDVPAGTRGAVVPWIEYEAEDGSTNGAVLEASREFGEIAAESSGRRSVKLEAAGQYVQFTASQEANSIVVRYVIPDAPAGGGLAATLSLYVDDTFRQKLNLTSKYAWSYGGEEKTLNDPAAGSAHHFFDEARALIEAIPAGATVKLQRDDDDTAEYYVLDLIDLEQVAPPKTMPAGYLSIVDCGAKADDGVDDGKAIQDCLIRGRLESKNIWIPAGTFESLAPLSSQQGMGLSDMAIQGAGMWHSTIHGQYARFYCGGNNCRFFDFSILGETTLRDDSTPENGFNGAAGSGSRMENVWVEHTKVGWWVGAGISNTTNGLVITGSRFRNLFADGVNLCNGASNSVVELSHFRNTGDDALASWAPSFDGGVNTNNVFRFNTVQVPWRANCFAIYGGRDNRVEDNLCYDVVTYPGILIAQQFKAWPFAGTTIVQRNSLIRAGGHMWNREHGALKIDAGSQPLSGLVIKDILIDSPTFSGLQIETQRKLNAATFENITIDNAGTYGILISLSTTGSAAFNAVVVTDAKAGGLRNNAPGSSFKITRGADNDGW
jgi:hypothetical protein